MDDPDYANVQLLMAPEANAIPTNLPQWMLDAIGSARPADEWRKVEVQYSAGVACSLKVDGKEISPPLRANSYLDDFIYRP